MIGVHLAALDAALAAIQGGVPPPPLEGSELLLIAHCAAKIYDVAMGQLHVTAAAAKHCDGTYWRKSSAYTVAVAAAATTPESGRKRGRPFNREMRTCDETRKLRRGHYCDEEGARVHYICNKCFKAYQRDVQDGMLPLEKKLN